MAVMRTRFQKIIKGQRVLMLRCCDVRYQYYELWMWCRSEPCYVAWRWFQICRNKKRKGDHHSFRAKLEIPTRQIQTQKWRQQKPSANTYECMSTQAHHRPLIYFCPTMKPFSLPSISVGLFIATFIAARGMHKKSLSMSGAVAAWMVGFLSLACGKSVVVCYYACFYIQF